MNLFCYLLQFSAHIRYRAQTQLLLFCCRLVHNLLSIRDKERNSVVSVCLSVCLFSFELLSVLWHCWLGGRKGIRPVKKEWFGAGVVICLERGADLHMAQLMPLPLTVSCFSKIQIGLPFWYQLTQVVLDKGPLNVCLCVRACVCIITTIVTNVVLTCNVFSQRDYSV